MSNLIEQKLNEIRGNILDGKNELSEALQFCGITNVRPNTLYPHDGQTSANYETFARYAELIRRLRTNNSFILEFNIPESAVTDYKRTIVLPMNMSLAGSNISLNNIAKEIINNDNSSYALVLNDDEPSHNSFDIPEEYYTVDMYGNKCIRGDITIDFTEDEIANILSFDEYNELHEIMIEYNINAIEFRADEDIPDYQYTVDWGDGSEECTFTNGESYENNKSAIWHTYEKSGVYDVTINGYFRVVRTDGVNNSNLVENGDYVLDKDGVAIINTSNYAMRNHLIEVIQWGNTIFRLMDRAFCGCTKLQSIPMYDTTNSFNEVTSFSEGFRDCESLTEIPFNINTNRGLLSNCEKLTNVNYMFYSCGNLSQPIPERLIDGCTNLSSAASMFSYCSKITGSIPITMFQGLSSLTNVSEIFAGCSNLDGELSTELFKDNPNINNIYRLFYGCNKIKGRLSRDIIGGLSSLTNVRQAFYNCSSIEGIDADAFYNLKKDKINFRDAFFGCKGITEIPSGLLESLTGENLLLERMFQDCTGIRTIPATALENLKVANARGMFGGCSNITSSLPNEHSDWQSYDTIKKWYGIFAGCDNMSVNANIPLELGGNGSRRFSEGKVGAIVLQDESFVDANDYTYNSNNKPVGIVYADVYIDSAVSTSRLGNGTNVVSKDSQNAVHKIYATVLNDAIYPMVSETKYAVDIPTITNTTNYEVCYNTGNTRYNGESCYEAILDFAADKPGVYRGAEYVNSYNVGINNKKGFIPDGTDLWDQFVMRSLMKKCTDKIVSEGGSNIGGTTFSNSNCYPIRNGTYYWASPEASSTAFVGCYTLNAYVDGYNYKWGSYYVRSSFAIEIP